MRSPIARGKPALIDISNILQVCDTEYDVVQRLSMSYIQLMEAGNEQL
jgi:hypothetical protein